MKAALSRRLGSNYALVVAGVTFLSLLIAAGLRSAPGVLLLPWQTEFGWSRGTISLAAAVGIFLYGLIGPFAAALMQTLGVRRTLVGALALMAISTALSCFMTRPWHLIATWGVLSGIGSGCVAMVLGATIVNRWFHTRQGLAMGLLTASTSTGALIFIPLMAWATEVAGWRVVAICIAGAAALLIPLVLLFLAERPADLGSRPFGAGEDAAVDAPPTTNAFRTAIDTLTWAARQKVFWLLFGAFFVCGFTTNGLVGTHLIALCADHGLAPVRAAGLMALMGALDLVGTTASGWLTDRCDPRKLLFIYYGLRGLSLIYLPFSDFSIVSLGVFAVFYGLDWIATVPPTLRLANQAFGSAAAPIVFGWIAAGHQLGAASAAFMGGALRQAQGRYLEAFLIAGAAALVAAAMSLMVKRAPVAV
jgi:predicted MFS family arabinose efflux permease